MKMKNEELRMKNLAALPHKLSQVNSKIYDQS